MDMHLHVVRFSRKISCTSLDFFTLLCEKGLVPVRGTFGGELVPNTTALCMVFLVQFNLPFRTGGFGFF